MKPILRIFNTPQQLAEAFAADLYNWIQQQPKITIALSGGSTPKLLFQHLAEHYATKIDWSNVHLYWGDERCVPPTDDESNFKMTDELLLQKITIPAENIHRIHGETPPNREANRYGQEIKATVASEHALPRFDLIILGMGDDGHTASIFPHQLHLLEATDICAVATHPNSGQYRVSLTGPVLKNAKKIAFLVTGASKAKKVATVLNHDTGWEKLPSAYIQPRNGELYWYLDEAAAKEIDTV